MQRHIEALPQIFDILKQIKPVNASTDEVLLRSRKLMSDLMFYDTLKVLQLGNFGTFMVYPNQYCI